LCLMEIGEKRKAKGRPLVLRPFFSEKEGTVPIAWLSRKEREKKTKEVTGARIIGRRRKEGGVISRNGGEKKNSGNKGTAVAGSREKGEEKKKRSSK